MLSVCLLLTLANARQLYAPLSELLVIVPGIQVMSYRTILVHPDEKNLGALLEPATRLAKRYGSRLIGINVYPRVPAASIRLPFAKVVVCAIAAAERTDAKEIAIIFSCITRNQPFTVECRADKSPLFDLAQVLIPERTPGGSDCRRANGSNLVLFGHGRFFTASGARKRPTRADHSALGRRVRSGARCCHV